MVFGKPGNYLPSEKHKTENMPWTAVGCWGSSRPALNYLARNDLWFCDSMWLQNL